MCHPDRGEHGGSREAPPERHRNQRLLCGAQSAAALFFADADRKDPDLLQLPPGLIVFLVRAMDTRQGQQFRQRFLDCVRQSQLLSARVILDLQLLNFASPAALT